MRVAVVGADDVVGRPLVEVLRRAGHTVVALTRANGVDLTRGRGVDGALRGCDAVVDVTTTRARRARDAEQFCVTVTDALMDAGASAGVRLHVVLSVVGLDGAERAPRGRASAPTRSALCAGRSPHGGSRHPPP